MANEVQTVPVRIYRTQDHLMVASPMPGLKPEDISVTISGRQITLRGENRGTGQHGLDLVLDEWSTGPYYRDVTLPENVNGNLSNATYGNGVLVLSMPKTASGEEAADANFQLRAIEATRGERVGHIGKKMHPTTTQEHAKKHQ